MPKNGTLACSAKDFPPPKEINYQKIQVLFIKTCIVGCDNIIKQKTILNGTMLINC